MGEMRLRAQHSIPKLNTVVNKRTTTTFMTISGKFSLSKMNISNDEELRNVMS